MTTATLMTILLTCRVALGKLDFYPRIAGPILRWEFFSFFFLGINYLSLILNFLGHGH